MSTTGDIDTLAKQARRLLRESRLPEAITLYRQALELDETRVDVHEALATAYFMAGELEKSVEHFKRVSELDPRQGRALINMGAAYNRLGKFEEAVKVLRRGIQKDRNFSEGFYNLGFAHRGLNQLSMAVSAYREAVRIDPKNPDSHVNLANVFVDMGNTQQAILHYKLALEVDPEFERAKRGMARAQQAKEASKSSISPFGRLVDQNNMAPKAVAKMERRLNDNERLKDRQRIHFLTHEIKETAKGCLKQLVEDFHPNLAELNRASAEGSAAPAALHKALGHYQAALHRFLELRRELKRRLLELRAHEEVMNTPSVKTSTKA